MAWLRCGGDCRKITTAYTTDAGEDACDLCFAERLKAVARLRRGGDSGDISAPKPKKIARPNYNHRKKLNDCAEIEVFYYLRRFHGRILDFQQKSLNLLIGMEQLLYILPRGMAIGALISAPMGPIGILIIQRTLSKGRWAGMSTGIGAALSDLIYCLLTGFGLSFITDFIEEQQLWLQLIGGIVLAVFALYLFKKNPTRSLKNAEQTPTNNYWTDFATGFLLTFSNPLILFFIIGLFARFCLILPEFTTVHYIFAYACLLSGALLWWYGVTWLVNRLRRRFNVRALWLVNRVVSTILMAMGVIGITMAIKDLIQ